MIGRLRGTLAEVEGLTATLDVAGVGYEVLVPESVLVQFPPVGDIVELRIRQVFREDGVSLYGFSEPFQRRLFDLLMQVKGCGPKIGLALIGQLGEEAVASAILGGDARGLVRATGVGPRLADRIILELKDKISEESFQRRVVAAAGKATVRLPAAPADELVEALVALGYRRAEAEAAAVHAREESEQLEEQLKAALRSLQR